MDIKSQKGTYVILHGKMPFWHLVVGAVGLRVTGIWGKVKCGGANTEDGGQTHLGTTRREKGSDSNCYKTRC